MSTGLLREHWYVAAFFLAELVWFGVMVVTARVRRDQAARGIVPPPHPSMEPLRGVRLAEFAAILYHFPVIVPTAMIRKDDSAPAAVLYLVTPILYSTVVYVLCRIA